MPRRGEKQQERNAALLTTYFHPFTLNAAVADDHVPYLGDLRGKHTSWHDALLHWFNGRVLTAESKRYVDNFLVVTRARPDGEDSGGENSDDIFSDEELFINNDTFEDALDTRMGKGSRKRDMVEVAGEDAEDPNARDAFEKAHNM